ncbi:hypothetical protein [Umezakia ovalisporum]|uniref:hypothetical protein n=1 Tax=Umezakia ovalisporum TaxID=75695 RepID=UPI0035B8593C
MTLSSINSNSQAGSLELLATELTSPPALLNNSGSTVTITLTATGQWSLINFETSDPTLIKYKTPVDGDGHPRDKNDEKYKLKYPQSNPGALVAEIKDAKGNTKSTVSGKQQSFELQPGETVSFLINDDPKWYGNNAGKLTISYTSTVKSTDPKPQPEILSITDLYNTGVDNARQVLADSIPDPHYTLATYPAGTELPGVTTPNKDLAPINWVPNTQTARWIGPKTPFANGPVGNYSYTTTFTLPEFSEALIVGELSVDDNITDIVLNGVSVGNPVPLSSWTKIGRFSISTGFVVGTNTLEFKLHSVGGPTGLRIDSISGTYKPSSLTAPIVVTVPPANAPTIPQGFHSPFTFTPSAAPVIQWNGYTYWAYSYTDNRMAMAILAYDAQGQIVRQWEKPGARYLTSITVDSAQKTIILTGQANQTTVLSWDELRL